MFARLGLRYQLAAMTALLVSLTAGAVGVAGYLSLKRELLRAIDAQLHTASHLAAAAAPVDYFDRISGPTSITPEEYRRIVDQNNTFCTDLGLQYLWSCMVLDGQVVFTTATSPSKNIEEGDHAKFLEVHSDPSAFDTVFRTMEIHYSSFHNEWGHGRMVLCPGTDSRGRKFCYGASISTEEVRTQLARDRRWSILISVTMMAVGVILSLAAAESVARPVEELTSAADDISRGDLGRPVNVRGSSELASLSTSVQRMSASIQETINALHDEIADHQRAREALARHKGHLEETVASRTAELQRSNQELEQFAYVASHDLQEPLRMVGSYVELLQRRYHGQLDERADEYIRYASEGARRMQQLIEDLLTYSRVGTSAKPAETVDLNQVLTDTMQAMKTTIDKAGAEVTSDPLPSVTADPSQLARLFLNLLGNGIKFRGDAAPRVHVSATGDDDVWTIRVEDNGIGIDPVFADRIFAIFQRLHTRDQYPGTGIGLAVCKRIVERHGGQIWVESKPGQGAAFCFTMPKQEAADG